jgi:hypothetical protein
MGRGPDLCVVCNGQGMVSDVRGTRGCDVCGGTGHAPVAAATFVPENVSARGCVTAPFRWVAEKVIFALLLLGAWFVFLVLKVDLTRRCLSG